MTKSVLTSDYGWKITEDLISSPGESDVGRTGPANIDEKWLTMLKMGVGQPFRLYDDDHEHYASGRLVGIDQTGFEPLDDYGTPNYGCTGIKYGNK